MCFKDNIMIYGSHISLFLDSKSLPQPAPDLAFTLFTEICKAGYIETNIPLIDYNNVIESS